MPTPGTKSSRFAKRLSVNHKNTQNLMFTDQNWVIYHGGSILKPPVTLNRLLHAKHVDKAYATNTIWWWNVAALVPPLHKQNSQAHASFLIAIANKVKRSVHSLPQQ
jgi:hypothetical protein